MDTVSLQLVDSMAKRLICPERAYCQRRRVPAKVNAYPDGAHVIDIG